MNSAITSNTTSFAAATHNRRNDHRVAKGLAAVGIVVLCAGPHAAIAGPRPALWPCAPQTNVHQETEAPTRSLWPCAPQTNVHHETEAPTRSLWPCAPQTNAHQETEAPRSIHQETEAPQSTGSR